MPTPDPPWKQRTRPCPFYSQGRCLFSDSCNFLHSVKTTSTPITIAFARNGPTRMPEGDEPLLVEPQTQKLSTPRSSVDHGRPEHSLSRSNSKSSRSPKSPSRSPRLASLLMALGDVIDPEEEGEEDVDEGVGEEEVIPSEEFPDYNAEEQVVDEGILSPSNDADRRDTIKAIPFPRLNTSTPGGHARQHSEHHNDPPIVVNPEAGGENLIRMLSPVDMANAPPIPFPFADDWNIRREDSIDSGYADSWQGPTPHVLSPPRSPALSSTFDLLHSPFRSPSSRVVDARPISALIYSPGISALAGSEAPMGTHSEDDVLSNPRSGSEDLMPPEGNLSMDALPFGHSDSHTILPEHPTSRATSGSGEWEFISAEEESDDNLALNDDPTVTRVAPLPVPDSQPSESALRQRSRSRASVESSESLFGELPEQQEHSQPQVNSDIECSHSHSTGAEGSPPLPLSGPAGEAFQVAFPVKDSEDSQPILELEETHGPASAPSDTFDSKLSTNDEFNFADVFGEAHESVIPFLPPLPDDEVGLANMLRPADPRISHLSKSQGTRTPIPRTLKRNSSVIPLMYLTTLSRIPCPRPRLCLLTPTRISRSSRQRMWSCQIHLWMMLWYAYL
ncbi:hypothetical protein JAAARDRAFT_571247 [Jaapia argillacea MUCL 33604]|uniref:C3H1-type domain-containing protein n=1 Tax=Jaapia argillacea MUCL 33604 TaxID=933084 RepID=A0A067Q1W1_9AGAM|nr:hypothetical protein JAAARDRAFT_571247 [Jaapia argillacea MUCL 33604]